MVVGRGELAGWMWVWVCVGVCVFVCVCVRVCVFVCVSSLEICWLSFRSCSDISVDICGRDNSPLCSGTGTRFNWLGPGNQVRRRHIPRSTLYLDIEY